MKYLGQALNKALSSSFVRLLSLPDCCFTSTETVGLLGTGAQDVHLDFLTAPELWLLSLLFIAFIQRYSLLSSRLTAHISHVVVNEWLYLFIARIFNINGSGVLIALSACCMAGAKWNCCHLRRKFCIHHSTVNQFTASLHSKPHRYGVCVFSFNLPPALLAEWPGSFTCYCGNTRWNEYQNKSQPQTVDHGEENYPAAPAGTRTRDLPIMSPTL